MSDYHRKRWTVVLADGRPLRGVSFDSIYAAWSFVYASRLTGAKPVPPVGA